MDAIQDDESSFKLGVNLIITIRVLEQCRKFDDINWVIQRPYIEEQTM